MVANERHESDASAALYARLRVDPPDDVKAMAQHADSARAKGTKPKSERMLPAISAHPTEVQSLSLPVSLSISLSLSPSRSLSLSLSLSHYHSPSPSLSHTRMRTHTHTGPGPGAAWAR